MGDVTLKHDDEHEFFADYRSPIDFCQIHYEFSNAAIAILMFLNVPSKSSQITVTMPKRSDIEAVFAVFEDAEASCAIPEAPPKIFIGHGHNNSWRDLKDHLAERHGFKVEAYEIGARAGLAIKDILEEMVDRSSFAILVLTAETKDTEGKFHARDNVIHEAGLFQGTLGFNRAIVLLQEGVEKFSNIDGIQYIPFSKNISETYGEVLASIKREFSNE